jgi:hypothetical protein
MLCSTTRDLVQRGRNHQWRLIMKKLRVFGIIGGAALLAAAPFSLQWSQRTVTLSLDSADARVGRPLTPLSVAGVQRRSYRRAVRSTVYAGAAAGAVGYGVGAYYGGGCSPSYGTGYGYGSYYGGSSYPSYSDAGYGYPSAGYAGYGYPSSGYAGYGYPSSGYAGYGYPSSGYAGYSYPSYGYGSTYLPGARVARRVAIHRARWR